MVITAIMISKKTGIGDVINHASNIFLIVIVCTPTTIVPTTAEERTCFVDSGMPV